MRGRACGNARERAFEVKLWTVGFRTARLSASGQRISEARQKNGIGADLIGIAPEHSGLPNLLVECGGIGKRLAVAFNGLRECSLPGFQPCVVRCVRRSWLYYTSPDDRHDDFASFIAALREAP